MRRPPRPAAPGPWPWRPRTGRCGSRAALGRGPAGPGPPAGAVRQAGHRPRCASTPTRRWTPCTPWPRACCASAARPTSTATSSRRSSTTCPSRWRWCRARSASSGTTTSTAASCRCSRPSSTTSSKAFADPEAARTARRTLENMFRVFLSRSDRDGDAALCAPEDRAFFESMIASGPQALCRALRGIIERDGRPAPASTSCSTTPTRPWPRPRPSRPCSCCWRPWPARTGCADADVARRPRSAGSTTTRPSRSPWPSCRPTSTPSPPRSARTTPRRPPGDLAEEISIYLSILSLGAAPGRGAAGPGRACGTPPAGCARRPSGSSCGRRPCPCWRRADTELLDQVLPRLAGPFRDRGRRRRRRILELPGRRRPRAGGPGLAPRGGGAAAHRTRDGPARPVPAAVPGHRSCRPERMLQEAARFEALSSFRPAAFSKALFYRPRSGALPGLRSPADHAPGRHLRPVAARGLVAPARRHGRRPGRAGRPAPTGRGLRDLYEAVLAHGQADDDAPPPRALLDAVHAAVDKPAGAEPPPGLGAGGPARAGRMEPRLQPPPAGSGPAASAACCVLPAWPKACRTAAKTALALADAEEGDRGD